jgi:type IV pilus secretin PilQ/predicted competence protein
MSKYGKVSLAVLAAGLTVVGTLQAGTAEPTAGSGAGAPVELREVRMDRDTEGRPVVVLDGTGPMDYETLELQNPARLVIDLKGAVSRVNRNQVAVDEAGIQRVRAGQFRTSPVPVSRVVVDLESSLPFDIEKTDAGLRVAFGAGTQPQAAPVAPTVAASPEAPADEPVARAVSADTIDKLLAEPTPLAAEEPGALNPAPTSTNFETQTIVTDRSNYNGKRISLNLVDTDVKQIFRLFHEISGLNFVLDPAVEGKVTIVLDQVPWDQALDIILKNNGLDKQMENNVVRIAPTSKLATEAAARKQLKEAKDLEVEPITITRTLSYGKAKDVEKVIRDGGILSARGKVMVDERTNALIISDIPKKIGPLDQLISNLDSETPQVMIEARIVQTSKSFSQDLGVVWGFTAIADASRGTNTGLAFPSNSSVKYDLNLPGAGTASNLAFKFGNILDSFTLDIALNDLETEGYGRVLSSPKIATQNNERAEIEQGVRIPIVSTTATEINVEFVSASLRLAVTPQITADGTVAMDVVVENNSPDFVNRVGDVPPINTQRAQTKILVADGGTAVIGGIFTVTEGQSEVGVPWFRKIPGLGWLFKTRNVSNENRELLIFITPKIVKIG